MAAPALLTAAEYFEIDDAAEAKHELVDGVIYAMAGGTPNHARLGARLTTILDSRLRGKGCVPYNSELRVALSFRTYAYPDATVICGEPETAEEDANTIVNPTVVFEVLSPSTEGHDRGRKRILYQRLPSIKGVVLVSSDEPMVEVFERQPDGSWSDRVYEGTGAVALLSSIVVEMPLGDLYEGIDFA